MAKTISLAMQKGGVGKTTTTIHLARRCVLAGKRTLVIDLDAQMSLTSISTRDPFDLDSVSIADVLTPNSGVDLAEVIVPGIWDGLDVAPSPGKPLGVARDQLVGVRHGREFRLRDAIAKVKDDYDVILLDLAPALDQISVNALVASDKVLIVAGADGFSETGLHMLVDDIEEVRSYYTPSLETVGILANGYEEQAAGSKQWIGLLQQTAEERGVPLLTPYVPRGRAIADSMFATVGLDEWKDRHKTGPKFAAIYEQHYQTLMEGAA